MKIIFVDHNDSFVCNLISWFQQNSKDEIVVLNCNELNKLKQKVLLRETRAVIFSPGPGHPCEYLSSIHFYQNLPAHIPFLGVCLGYQLMLYARGATLKQISEKPIHGQQVKLCKKISSRLLSANSLQGYFVLYNSLGVEIDDPVFQNKFKLLAAKKYALAAEHVFLPHVGVQFHPESFASTGGDYFLRSFLRLLG